MHKKNQVPISEQGNCISEDGSSQQGNRRVEVVAEGYKIVFVSL
jgi:hypothetical protein